MYKKKIIISADGSHTIELIGKNEQYHSTYGAIQESQHVYIKNGLAQLDTKNKNIHILEVGMGTGLNVLLSYQYAQQHHLNIHYTAVEAYPLEEEIWSRLNYPQSISGQQLGDVYRNIHQLDWNKDDSLSENFILHKVNRGIEDIDLSAESYDLVYFDAFNPDLEPMLWTEKLFKKIFDSMKYLGLLTTYSTKGIVKRALKSSGFHIDKKPGPPGKREILNAIKQELSE